MYLATVEDLASRRIVGFGLSEHHDAELATGALKMAVAVRGGDVAGTIFHSDRGSEYTATMFESACSTLAISQSMGRVGSCFDNAAAESWFSTLEWELFRKRHFDTKQTARREVAQIHRLVQPGPPAHLVRDEAPGRVRSDPRLPGRRNGHPTGGGVKPASIIASQARNETEWHETPGR